VSVTREVLLATAREAARHAYAPYSNFPVGAALAFANGTVVTGANVENASYGLSLCAETVAAVKALSGGERGGLVAVAVSGPGAALTPCTTMLMAITITVQPAISSAAPGSPWVRA
jgi:cytidine deaminase